MARFAILNTVDWEACRSLAGSAPPEDEVMRRLTGHAWLLRVDDGVDDVLDAVRNAIGDFLATGAGVELLRREALDRLEWEEAMRWVPEETWRRSGLEVLGHPEVERLVVDAREDLAPRDRAGFRTARVD